MGTRNERHSYAPWEPKNDRLLMELSEKGVSYEDLAMQTGRTVGAIKSRLRHLAMLNAADNAKKQP